MATDYSIYDAGTVVLQSGAALRNCKLAYKTFGKLNAKKDNVIVYPTWYSGQHYDNEWLVGAGMGVYHAGVEWGFWEGPATCATTAQGVTQNAGDLLSDLNSKHGPSCQEASFRLLGLSFAGWNVIASLILAAIAFSGAPLSSWASP